MKSIASNYITTYKQKKNYAKKFFKQKKSEKQKILLQLWLKSGRYVKRKVKINSKKKSLMKWAIRIEKCENLISKTITRIYFKLWKKLKNKRTMKKEENKTWNSWTKGKQGKKIKEELKLSINVSIFATLRSFLLMDRSERCWPESFSFFLQITKGHCHRASQNLCDRINHRSFLGSISSREHFFKRICSIFFFTFQIFIWSIAVIERCWVPCFSFLLLFLNVKHLLFYCSYSIKHQFLWMQMFEMRFNFFVLFSLDFYSMFHFK